MGKSVWNTEKVRHFLEEINISLISEYISYKKKIKLQCNKDGNIWETSFACIKGGSRCHKCSKVYKRTHEEFIEEVNKINPDIIVLGVYTKAITPIEFKCCIDGNTWKTTPNSILKGSGCSLCSGMKKKDTNMFSEKLKLVNPNIEVIGNYVTARKPIKVRCKICLHEWSTTSGNLICSKPRGCPLCSATLGEKEVARVLRKMGLKYVTEFSPNFAKEYRYDFLVEDNILIEFDGVQHFEEVNKGWITSDLRDRLEIDRIKNKLALENGYRIVRISHSEIEHIEEALACVDMWHNKLLHIGKEYNTQEG